MRPAQDHRLAATIAEVDRLRVQVAQLQREQRLGVVEIPLPSVRWVVEAVAAEWGVTPTTILSVRRARPRGSRTICGGGGLRKVQVTASARASCGSRP